MPFQGVESGEVSEGDDENEEDATDKREIKNDRRFRLKKKKKNLKSGESKCNYASDEKYRQRMTVL